MNRKHLGSDIFETSIMKTDECVIFCMAAQQNCESQEQILEDMHTIDDLLHMKRLHLGNMQHIKYTRTGNIKKSATLADSLMKIIEGKLK